MKSNQARETAEVLLEQHGLSGARQWAQDGMRCSSAEYRHFWLRVLQYLVVLGKSP